MKKILYRPSPKMIQLYNEVGNYKHRLVEGAVRSAKSFTCNDIAIKEIQSLPPCDVLVSGYSISSVARNVLAEWKNAINPPGNKRDLFKRHTDAKDDYLTIDWRGLRGKKFYVRGAGKENDFKQIQGATFGYWYADELARHTESFFDMAFTRMSPPWARSLWTTNADTPFHFVKKRLIDDVDMHESGLLNHWTFFLKDNPSLTPEYIKALEQMYTGVFYRRYILSQWVLAEGVIYDFFTEDDNVLKTKDVPEAEHYVLGIDYGTGNPTAFILFGVNQNTRPMIWAEREWYYDSKEHQRQMTDDEYSACLKRFCEDWIPPQKRLSGIYVDPSAASFKAQMRKDGFLFINDADNDVLNGIRTQAVMLKSGLYAVSENCPQTIKDYSAYMWDERAQLRGEDKPVKQHDHTKDAERYPLHTLFESLVNDYAKFVMW